MDSRRKLQAVRRRLGEPKQEARQKGEYGFPCPHPKCDSARQGKVKLWVNPERDRFHCWHCGFKGGSLAALMVPNSPDLREYLDSRPRSRPRVVRDERPRCTTLPDGFTPFALDGSHREATYLSYLTGRGVSRRTVALYRMGYVDAGQLAGRVVIPSFDRYGMVNFWSARSVWASTPHEYRYRLPVASKDVISNEHMVDWTRPVYLVEGIFDEIAIGPQAIALYGKTMPPQLALRLVEQRPPTVHVCLDNDAVEDALDLMTRLVGYDLPCTLVDLDDKDPAVAGREVVERTAAQAPSVTGSAGLVEARL